MSKKYDVVVIGAGNGGLTAACAAAKLGLKTLLAERHNLPGGVATSFVRGRFEFEAALHELSAVGTPEQPGAVRKLFDRLGVGVEWRAIPEAYRLIVTGGAEATDIVIPFGVEAYTAAIDAGVPGSGVCVAQFLDMCREVTQGAEYVSAAAGAPDSAVLAAKYPNFMRTAGASLWDVQDFLHMPPRARAIVNVFWCYLGLGSAAMDFQTYAVLLYNKLRNGAHVPRMRSHEIAAALDGKIRENGGVIRYNTKVTAINVRASAVTGVTLAGGEEIETDHVISDVTQHVVFSQLIAPETEIPARQLKMANSRGKFACASTVYLGLNKPAAELGLNSYSYFIFPSGDDNVLFEQAKSIETGVAQTAVCLNAAVPDCSPEGTCILYCFAAHGERAWDDVNPRDYFRIKDEIAGKMIDYFERSLRVDLAGCIEEIEVAAPATVARYTGNYQGFSCG
jgi:prolycopene isomerase